MTEAGVSHDLFPYPYESDGGARGAAARLGVDPHHVIKTLVFEGRDDKPLLVLMHGDLRVSEKALARRLGLKSVRACAPAAAQRHTGYLVGGISPFGTRVAMPVYIEAGLLGLETIYLNAGKRGLLARIRTVDLVRALEPGPVSVGIP